jgi:hypothetical protein
LKDKISPPAGGASLSRSEVTHDKPILRKENSVAPHFMGFIDRLEHSLVT